MVLSNSPTALDSVSILDMLSVHEHEQVLFCYDSATGLRAIIAIHNTVLGPALGGTRLWQYAEEKQALTDVLRLSRGMTFKAAISGLDLGGGKAVIIGQPTIKSEALFRRFGQFVDSLSGKYITAEDVNISVKDVELMMKETQHVVGRSESNGGSGDPSPVTAYGVYMGIKACLKHRTGSESLAQKTVLVQGTGKVGEALAKLLHHDGAKLILFDIDKERVKKVAQETNAQIIHDESEIASTPCDVYAPCALGAGLNPTTIPQLNCSIVAGAANNQLLEEKRDGQALKEKDILYAPDFLINAGGLINVSNERIGYNAQRAKHQTEGIYDTLLSVINIAEQENITPHEAALRFALDRIDRVAKINAYSKKW
ncbi:MAG: leucine dehydrogenase [Bacteroidia bacterium]|nr:leucine dehydrogenase [Bacteroidia bacterium]